MILVGHEEIVAFDVEYCKRLIETLDKRRERQAKDSASLKPGEVAAEMTFSSGARITFVKNSDPTLASFYQSISEKD